MVDFFVISTRQGKRGIVEIYPRFIIKKSSDLMIRGGDFYAVWLEDQNRWSTDQDDVFTLIDSELSKYYEENKTKFDVPSKVLYIRDAENGIIDRWHKYCEQQMIDSFHMLDEKIVFANTVTTKKDYSSNRLKYPLEAGDTSAYDKLMSTLYSDEERHKIEWAIGSIVTGDSKKLQKFVVLYGEKGTGKSTVMNIIAELFDGYCSVFDAKSLGSANNQFALEAFKDNPLVAIQHDGNLSRIEDNTRLNSLVSHEKMVVNEKHKSLYKSDFKTFLFMGTNNPVRITDARSGILRRLIDVSPTGNTLSVQEYKTCVKQVSFELGAIAWHCKEVYLSDPDFYDDYVPVAMLGASNDFYNFVMDSYLELEDNEGVTLDSAWKLYKTYCEEAKVYYPLSKKEFREELKPYFNNFTERCYLDDGTRVRSYYSGFKSDKFFNETEPKPVKDRKTSTLIDFVNQPSLFDSMASDYPAQYASDSGTPLKQWSKVDTTLASIDTSKLHYVKVPENHIVIDFDIPDDDGNKDFKKNVEEASKWPPTYAELSKSGAGIHLHYIYTGDPTKLSRVYADHIEVKVFSGNSSLRRMLTKCNNLPIATLSSGLPLQEEKKIDGVKIKSQKKLFELIERNLKKEIHAGTKPSCDFIYKIVEDAYNDGVSYDIPDEMKKRIMAFAKNSTHQSDYCVKLMKKMHYQSPDMENTMDNNNRKLRELIKKTYIDKNLSPEDKIDIIYEALDNAYNSKMLYDLRDIRNSLVYFSSDQKGSETVEYCLSMVSKMKFSSEDPIENEKPDDSKPIAFFDVEVFPNLFILNWKLQGEENPVIRLINPTASQVEELFQKYRMVGYNCRRYDNHICYARMMGYSNEQLYKLSQSIIGGIKDCFFGEAYNLSYTDIYDFASAGNKVSLKKLEILMGIHHQELGLPWDKPVPKELWEKVAEYCDNDVIATEAAFDYLQGDWMARQILADLADMTVNDTTNSLTTRIIFGRNRNPQDKFNYRDLSKPVKSLPDDVMRFLSEACPDMMSFEHGAARSLLPYFPGYKYEYGVSKYRGEEVGEGGYVYAEPGIYTNVALLDVASMHPHSLIAECLFGVEFTTAFRQIVEGRVDIKHEAWSKVDKILDGKLKPYIQKVKDGEIRTKDLANALKTAINSVYGLTSAKFVNPFKDLRNKDNIVAKRGALFMIDLKHAVQEKGFTVAHIKTDSIKIPNATPEIIKFVMDFGKKYGYTFEHEATYEKMCLVNDAVYIAKYADGEHEFELPTGEKIMTPWTATGTEFQIPYVFKTLFSKSAYQFSDFCETKSVSSQIFLDMNENLGEDEHNYIFVGRIGQFCPVIDGVGGGILYREKDGKYYAVTGTKGYRWMESEMVKSLKIDEIRETAKINTDVPGIPQWNIDWGKIIDMSYYKKLVDDAVKDISKHGDFEWFAS
ncbi:MAG: hypothetical protein J6Y02_21560 [Pseudobutyrivibrio sp.]|nr:hypothetical protein [Pseudobutyrivibrio sp.]